MKPWILGIETSCDDTSVALVDREGAVAAIETVSQFEIHQAFGGVYPELASRAHLEAILPTVQKVMDNANVTPDDLEAIGVTRGPGLIGSLLVGLSTAEALSLGWGGARLRDQSLARAYPFRGSRRRSGRLSRRDHAGVGRPYLRRGTDGCVELQAIGHHA